jgi:REP element-mobilizing transposase RayT
VPVHVTIKLLRGLWSLRTDEAFAMVLCRIKAASRATFRIVQYSVQHDHLHLIVEAESNRALSTGVQGLSVRIAQGLNRLMRRTGSAFKDRYHARLLSTPRELKNALVYLINNGRKHLQQIGKHVRRGWLDPCASVAALGPWCPLLVLEDADPPPVAKPKSWLLRLGFTKSGSIALDEIRG